MRAEQGQSRAGFHATRTHGAHPKICAAWERQQEAAAALAAALAVAAFMCLNIQNRRYKKEKNSSQNSSQQSGGGKTTKSARVGVNAEFFAQCKKLFPIIFPSKK
jgi:hypothetical protein